MAFGIRPEEVEFVGDGSAFVPMTQGFRARVDLEDLELVTSRRWKILRADGHLYAARTSGPRTILMHRMLTQAANDLVVDHRNGDGLDNRRGNIRIATTAQNNANRRKTMGSSRFKGVAWNKRDRVWTAAVGNGYYDDGKQRVAYIGRFSSEEEAARAYDAKALELFGEFALLNFPNSEAA